MTALITKPMLAGTVSNPEKDIRFPVWATPKLDGIRCLKIDGRARTKSFKLIQNKFIREFIEANYPDGVDGELMVPMDDHFDCGPITRENGEPDFRFYCFDYVTDSLYEPYVSRMEKLKLLKLPRMVPLIPILIENYDKLLAFEKVCLDKGFEGVMLRSGRGPYKLGRSTVTEGYLLKFKRFNDGEAVITELIEQQHNGNEATTDAFGRTTRSSHKANKTGKGVLGAFRVYDIKTGVEFKIGTGFDDKFKKWAYENPDKCLNKICKYKWQVAGADKKPRFPVWMGFRDPSDM